MAKPVREHTVKATWEPYDEHGDLTVLEVAADRRAEHQAVDPRLAGLLLRDRARPELRPECA